MEDKVTIKGCVETEIVSNVQGNKVFEITRTVVSEESKDFEEIVLISLYPTSNGSRIDSMDLSNHHLMQHLAEMKVRKVHLLFLIADVSDGRKNCQQLFCDTENLKYIEAKLKEYSGCKLVYNCGTAMSKNSVMQEIKKKLWTIVRNVRPNEQVYQIGCKGMSEEENYHVLYLGVKFSSLLWQLLPYKVPVYEQPVKKSDGGRKQQPKIEASVKKGGK